MRHFDYFKPQSLDEAWALKEKHPDARFIAGGTDLMVQIKNQELRPPALISLRSIPELSGVERGKVIHIGALTTISDIIQHPSLGDIFPILVDAARRVGSVQIRNTATIGGNLCNGSPCADMALPILVLEAKLRLQTSKGSREIQVNEFFRGPGETSLASEEILTHILLERPEQNIKTIFLKKGRIKMDLAIASIAILLVMDGRTCLTARIAAGSVAPVPMRLYEVEALLEGTTISRKLAAEAQHLASDCVSPITDIRATEEYRRQIVGVYTRRGLETILGFDQT